MLQLVALPDAALRDPLRVVALLLLGQLAAAASLPLEQLAAAVPPLVSWDAAPPLPSPLPPPVLKNPEATSPPPPPLSVKTSN